jgi:3-hydroxyisobutyrate dehydrogenase/2-hydroxy-3-oxopropionate reductase
MVISSLADDAAVLETYTGSAGVAAGLHEGQIVLEMSTVAPRTVRLVGSLVEERGATLLDAPVSGSVPAVEKGELAIMVGGSRSALDRARPVLDALATRVFHVGELGAGATVKLAVNALVHAIDVGLAEALVLAEKAGVDRAAAYDVFAAGAAAAPFVLYKREAFEHPDDAPLTFSLDLMAKDLDLILDLAREVGARMDQAAQNRKTVGQALAAGFAGRDMSAVATYLRGSGADPSFGDGE